MTSREVHRIFISHSSDDRDAFERLVHVVQSQIWAVSNGRELCFEVYNPYSQPAGRMLSEELLKAITGSALCIFVATARSLRSAWCGAELGAFWGQGKKALIYVPDPSAIDRTELPRQYAGMRHATSEEELTRTIKEFARTDLARTHLRGPAEEGVPPSARSTAIESRTVIRSRHDD